MFLGGFFMSEATVAVLPRQQETKSDLRNNRENGKIPGVIYGKKVSSEPIYIDEKELVSLLKTSRGSVMKLQVPNVGEQTVMIGEVQRDKVLQNRILHIDFHQIDMNEHVKATVRVELTGEPQGVEEGGILQQMNGAVDVRCLASAIPSSLTVDVSHLKVGEHFYVRDLQPPGGVEIRSDENEIIATVLAPQKELPVATDEIRDEDVAEKTAEVVGQTQE
jgi:large subunit ribosomal protein L25